ncbi:hypothetical protein PKF05_06550 [Fusobacterium simiae]|nr:MULTISPECIES: hypothetical protein [Fusobacterium]MDC7955484.1 hypothetical protein [Fusobacterium simiae]
MLMDVVVQETVDSLVQVDVRQAVQEIAEEAVVVQVANLLCI